MKHFYTNIEGFFNTEQKICYKGQVKTSKNNSHFVEVGAWKGKSTSYLAVEILNSGKKIKYDVIDTWMGTPSKGDNEYQNDKFVKTNTLYEHFLENIEPVKNIVNPMKMSSVEASKLFNDNSLDFVFIDASHDYESVKEDIQHWLPKVCNNGIIAGDDMIWPKGDGVYRAVNDMLPKHIQIHQLWIYKK